MTKSLAADTRLLSVSIVAGPSATALLNKIETAKVKVPFVFRRDPKSESNPAQIAEKIGAIAEKGSLDRLVMECDAETPAMAYASLFLSPPLTELARLTSTVFAISPTALLDILVHRRAATSLGSACFVAEQLEFVSDIFLEGGPDHPDFELARAIAMTLNPRAQVSDFSSQTLERLFNRAGTSVDVAAALDGAGWRKLIDAEESHADLDYNITAFAYRARKPFHPERFWNLLQNDLSDIFRAKGFFWFATRMDLVGGLNLAGSECHSAAAGEWWAARDDHARQLEMPERTRKEWEEPFGDRRQAIAFMGIDLDPVAFKAELDNCLLTASEMATGEAGWKILPDPFPSWSVHTHRHECDHDHESGDHDCCHH